MTGGAPEPSGSPFRADPAIAQRMSDLGARVGAAIVADVAAFVGEPGGLAGRASTVPADAAGDLVARHGLASTVELALLALPVAAAIASPPISTYRVGAVGIEGETGDLVLGGNLEFPGSELGWTVHAEGFVSLRARRRATTIATLAITEAHPCAHCRQTLAESAGAAELKLVDPLGHVLKLWDLYPWPFTPGALGLPPDVPNRTNWPDLVLDGPDAAEAPADLLLELGRRAHAPYSGEPSAVVVRLEDGRLLGAGCVESVSFNPSISATQAALVEVVAAGSAPRSVTDAWLAATQGGAIDAEPGFRSLLHAAAPNATARVLRWRVR